VWVELFRSSSTCHDFQSQANKIVPAKNGLLNGRKDRMHSFNIDCSLWIHGRVNFWVGRGNVLNVARVGSSNEWSGRNKI